jgi:hypothetical protein
MHVDEETSNLAKYALEQNEQNGFIQPWKTSKA